MSDQVLATLIGLVACGLLGLLVPRLIAAVPEPAPKEPAAEPAADSAPEPAKEPYADIAAHHGLTWRSGAISGLSGAVVGWTTGLDWPLVWLVPLVPIAVALSTIDWHTRLLPRLIVIPATLASILAVVAVGLATDQREELVRALIAMVAVRSFFWVLWFVRSAGMGFGDVRLAAPVGLVLGWVGWGALAVGVWIGFIIFALPGLALAVVKRDRSLLKKPFPYGPFMVVGALVGLVWGPPIAAALWG